MSRSFYSVTLAFALFTATACGPKKLRPEEIDRNRIFAAILDREDRRFLGEDDFLPANLLHSPSPQVRVWCAIALGRIGDTRALPWLLSSLGSELASARAASAFAIGEIEDRDLCRDEKRTPHAEALSALAERLQDSSLQVRLRAVEALGKAGNASHSTSIEALLEKLGIASSPEEVSLANAAITALMRLHQPSSLPLLRRLAGMVNPDVQWRALNALVRMKDKESSQLFTKLLRSADPAVRAHAARGIGLCDDPQLAAELISLVRQHDLRTGRLVPFEVRMSAIQSLGLMRALTAPAALRAALGEGIIEDQNPEQVLIAIQIAAALGNIGGSEARDILASLIRLTGSVANAALPALAQVLQKEPESFFEIAGSGASSQPEALRAWVRALGVLGGAEAERRLKGMLIDAAEGKYGRQGDLVIPSVIESLAKVKPLDLQPILRAYLGLQDPVVVRSALAGYAPDGGSKEPWLPVTQAYERFSSSQDVEVKTALLRRLETWVQHSEVRNALHLALRDPVRPARLLAASLLRQAGAVGIPDEPGPGGSRFTERSYNLAASSRKDRTIAEMDTSRGTIEIELFREDAPLTVANFASLASSGFFDGLSFMRVVPYFVVQGGDPRNDQEGGPGYAIRCEINMRPFERGSIGMALAGKDTGGSQFFIALSPQPHLDGGYTCFGRVIAGMRAVEKLVPGDRILHVRIREERFALDNRHF